MTLPFQTRTAVVVIRSIRTRGQEVRAKYELAPHAFVLGRHGGLSGERSRGVIRLDIPSKQTLIMVMLTKVVIRS